MLVKQIPLSDLVVNRANDRHGELASEREAINWLFREHRNQMHTLAKRIVSEGGLLERPLVLLEKDKFIAFDGNRRVACLKSLLNPNLLAVNADAEAFHRLRSDFNITDDYLVECDVEDDEEKIERIIYLRHSGSQNGAGQFKWTASAKSNFQYRTGRRSQHSVGVLLEKYLLQTGYINSDERIKTSIFDRLFSNPQLQKRAGFSIEGNTVKELYEKSAIERSIKRIVKDSEEGAITLRGLWRNTDKDEYLDSLDRIGALPTADEMLPAQTNSEPQSQTDPSNADNPIPRADGNQPPRLGLIPTNMAIPVFVDDGKRLRLLAIELRDHLRFSHHNNAISVSFRVLTELTIELYESVYGLEKYPNDKLHKRFRRVIDHLLDNSEISREYHVSLQKFEQGRSLFSATTMHSYIHASDFFPSPYDLRGFWDSLERFFKVAWASCKA